MTEPADAQRVVPLPERRVVHGVTPGAAVAVAPAVVARLFGVALVEALERRRAEAARVGGHGAAR